MSLIRLWWRQVAGGRTWDNGQSDWSRRNTRPDLNDWARFNDPPNPLQVISGTGFYGSNDPTNSVKVLKKDRSKGLGFNPIRFTPIVLTIRYTRCGETLKEKHKLHTDKHKYIYGQWNGPDVTKPNPENCKNCSVFITVHSSVHHQSLL